MRLLLFCLMAAILVACRTQGPRQSCAAERAQYEMTLSEQRAQIDSLAQMVNKGNSTMTKVRTEVETLRNIMKGYILTIDSLHRTNQNLDRELDSLKKAQR